MTDLTGHPSQVIADFCHAIPYFSTTREVNLPIELEIYDESLARIAHLRLNLLEHWRFQGLGANIFVHNEGAEPSYLSSIV